MGFFCLVIGIFIGGSIGILLMAAACLASRADRARMDFFGLGMAEFAEAASMRDNNNSGLQAISNIYLESVATDRFPPTHQSGRDRSF